MLSNPPSWLKRLTESWSFYYRNFTLSLGLGIISLFLFIVSLFLLKPVSANVFGQALMAVAIGMALAGLFNVLYETRTRESFRQMLAEINPNIQSGVIVHPNHNDVIPREVAIQKYLRAKQEIRIITSTADNYVRKGEPAYDALIGKVKREECKTRILLYLPVLEQREGVRVGQRQRAPQELMLEHQALMADYACLLKEGKGSIEIKFFTIPLHVNFIMIGNERMYSAPLLHSLGGRNLPCYEIYPTGDDSLFYKFQNDFDYIYSHNTKGVVIEFDVAKVLYEKSSFRYDNMRKLFVEQCLLSKEETELTSPEKGDDVRMQAQPDRPAN